MVKALNAALFGRATTVVRHRSDVADYSEIEPHCLQRADRGFTPGSGSFYQNFHFFEPVTHCLSRGVLCNHLRCVGRALARPFKANFPSARPPDHVAFHVGDRHDRVVESRKHVRDARVNVFATFGFDDLWLLDALSRKRKIL